MKKYIIYSFLLAISLLGLAGCEKDSSMDDSRLTYYVAFALKGDDIMLVTVNTPFVDPGVTATLKGADASSRVKVTGNVDTNTIGLYNVTYSAINDDGFKTSVSRKVIVCNPAVTTDISGTYTSVSPTHRLRTGTTVSYSGFDVTITKIAPGFFFVSDFFGGYYFPRLDPKTYTSSYVMGGYVKLNEDNTIGLLTSHIASWGDSLDGLAGAVYDPTAKSLYWEASYAGSMTFYVTLNKK